MSMTHGVLVKPESQLNFFQGVLRQHLEPPWYKSNRQRTSNRNAGKFPAFCFYALISQRRPSDFSVQQFAFARGWANGLRCAVAGKLMDDRAIGPVVAMAIMGEVAQRIGHVL